MTSLPHVAGTVLIVDDIPINQYVLAEALRGEYGIKVATNGPTALTIAQGESPPDLILLDVMMPGMDGYEVCRRLKADPATRDIPVIFVTARGEEADENLGFEVGAVDYVTKPVSPRLVLARVRTQLALKRARDTLVSQNQALETAAQLRDEVDRILRHDLKSPLVTIIGMAEVLLEEPTLGPPQLDYVATIHRSSHALLQMLNLSLDLFKMETGHYRLKPAPMDLLALVRQVIKALAVVWQDRRFEVTVAGVPVGDEQEGLELKAEKLLCYSMLNNLLQNACEAAPSGGMIALDLTPGDKTLVVSLLNEGETPVEVRERFFAKYVTHGKSHGTGLGTYSARLIAQAHGGDITLDTSRPGYTRLLITLPLT